MTKTIQSESKPKNSHLKELLITNASTPILIYLANRLAETSDNSVITTATYIVSGTILLSLVTKDLAVLDDVLRNRSSEN